MNLCLSLLILLCLVGCQVKGSGNKSSGIISNHRNYTVAWDLTLPSSGWYKLGDHLDLTLHFPVAVTVIGVPYIAGVVGATSRNFNYYSGDGTTDLIFRYTVAATDLDTDGVAFGTNLILTGSTITYNDNGVVKDCPTIFPVPSNTVKVDGIVPTYSSATPPSDALYGTGQTLTYVLTFSENVTVTGTPAFDLNFDSGAGSVRYLSGSGTTNITFSHTITSSEIDGDGFSTAATFDFSVGTLKDQAGNSVAAAFTAISTPNIQVNQTAPGVPFKLTITTQPSATATAGATFVTQPVVQVRDSYNNVATTSSDSVTLTAYTNSTCTTASSSTLVGTTTLAASSGVATFSGISHTMAETIYIKATSGSLVSACSSAVAVSPAAAAKVSFLTLPSAQAASGVTFSSQPVVQILDTYNNVITSSSANVSLSSYTNAGCTVVSTQTLSGTTTVAAVNGVSTFTNINHTKMETLYIKATSGALTTACSSAVIVSSGPATKVVFSTSPSSSATAGTAFATQPVLQIQDASNNVVTSSSANITIAAYTDSGCSSASSATLVGTTTVAASLGVGTFSGINHTKAETIYMKATSGSLSSACSASIAVSPGAAAKVKFTSTPAGTATAGVAFGTQPVIQIQDANNNLVTSSSANVVLAAYTNSACTTASGTSLGGTTTVAASAGVSTFSGIKHTKAETLYIKASSGALTTACSSLITVSPASATNANSSISATGPIIADNNQFSTISVTLADAYNNPISGITPVFSGLNGSDNVSCGSTVANGTTACSLTTNVTGTRTIGFLNPGTLTLTTSLTINPVQSNLQRNDSVATTFNAPFVCGSSQSRVYTFINNGYVATGSLTVNMTGAAADWSKGSDTCNGATLSPSQTCSVTVVFACGQIGASSNNTLTVTGTASNISAWPSLSLTGSRP